jgi:membrane fusion protein (multidrug efflux system)
MKSMRRVTPGSLAAALLGLSCALATSALIARQQALADEGPTAIGNAEFAGEIRPAGETVLTAPAAVLITKTLASVGDRVAAGQALVEVDDTHARAALAAAELTFAAATRRVEYLRQASASLADSVGPLASSLSDANRRLAIAERQMEQVPVRQWKDSPERAAASYEQAVINQRRTEELWHKGFVSRQEFDDASIGLRIATNDLETARQAAEASRRLAAAQEEQARLQAELTLVERRREHAAQTVELNNAELELARAEADVAEAKRQLEHTVIRATAAGTVVELAVHPGDRLPHGAVLVRTAELDRLVALIDVPARLVNGIRKDRVVRVQIANQATPVDGRIRSIAPLPGSTGTHAVEVEFQNPKDLLLANQIAQVTFQ